MALRRIGQLLTDHFHRGLVTVVYKGEDQKLHVQIVSNCNSETEQKDLALRTVQQIEKATTGLITTLTPAEKRLR